MRPILLILLASLTGAPGLAATPKVEPISHDGLSPLAGNDTFLAGFAFAPGFPVWDCETDEESGECLPVVITSDSNRPAVLTVGGGGVSVFTLPLGEANGRSGGIIEAINESGEFVGGFGAYESVGTNDVFVRGGLLYGTVGNPQTSEIVISDPDAEGGAFFLAINNAGLAIGHYSVDVLPLRKPFTFDVRAQILTDLSSLITSVADINDSGTIVGVVEHAPNDYRAASLEPGAGAAVELGVLPGDANSVATGINNRGEIVGRSDDGTGGSRPFLIRGGVMSAVPMPTGAVNGSAEAINDTGTILGYYFLAGELRSFLVVDDQAYDFELLASEVEGAGSEATRIDDAGRIYASVLLQLISDATPNLWQGSLGETASFTDETKWSKGVVPAAAEPVNLGAGTSTITLPESVEHARLVSELGGAHAFALGQRTLTLTDASDALRITKGIVRFSGGGVGAGATTIDDGRLILEVGANFVGTEFSVNGNSLARLTAGADATVTSLRTTLGDPGGGGGLFLSGAGTTFHSTSGGLIVGDVEVDTGALLSFGNDAFVICGDNENAAPVNLIADGSGTEISFDGSFFNVLRGALLIVRNGAVFSAGSDSALELLGGDAQFLSRATLRDVKVKLGGNLGVGASAEVTADAIRVEGDSTAAITGGGTLETFVLELGGRNDDDSHGEMSVSGAGSRLVVKQRLDIDPLASGLLSVRDGASVDFRSGLVQLSGNEREGRLEARGTGTTITGGDYLVQGGGAINVEAGASLTAAPDSLSEIINGEVIFSGNARGTFAALELREGATFDLTGSSVVSATTLNITNSEVSVSVSSRLVLNTVTLGAGATLGGGGTVEANVINNGGTIEPGESPGVLTIQGNYSQTAGDLVLEVGGAEPGTQHDRLLVTGDFSATGGGILLSFVDGFAPAPGVVFDFLETPGAFDASAPVRVTGLLPGWEFSTHFDPATGRFTVTSFSQAVAAPTPALLLRLTDVEPATATEPARFSATVSGPAGAEVAIEASTDLGNNWRELGRLTFDGAGQGSFAGLAHPESIGSRQAFLRLRSLP